MGPRIILHGAIPIDSNIGGSGHRPLLEEVLVVGPCCLLPFFLRAERVLVVSLALEVSLQRPFLLRLKHASS